MKRLSFVLLLGGCAQILGLENTKFDQRDAMTDAPGSCDGAPACISTAGRRSTCGQLVKTGTDAGQPLRVASPTGSACMAGGQGPCAATVFGQPMAQYFAGTTVGMKSGVIDDCGRFVVQDLDQTQANIAIVFSGAGLQNTATLVLGRPTQGGEDRGVIAPIVTDATVTAWGMQLDSMNPPSVSSGYLVQYTNMTANDAPLAMEQLRIDGGATGKPPAQPWGAYFTGSAPFAALDPNLTETQGNGTAVVSPGSGSFMLGGFRPGKTCAAITLEVVNNTLIYVRLSC